jgi:hypothetical protein
VRRVFFGDDNRATSLSRIDFRGGQKIAWAHVMPNRDAHSDVVLLLGSLVLVGCAYQPDSFSYARESFTGVYVTVDCLDLAIDHEKQVAKSRNVITYAFGNRCDEPVVVDLAAVKVLGHTGDGTEMPLYAFDPEHEIRTMRIDARAVGKEAIEYPSKGSLANMCIDVGSIARSNVPRWVCFNGKD